MCNAASELPDRLQTLSVLQLRFEDFAFVFDEIALAEFAAQSIMRGLKFGDAILHANLEFGVYLPDGFVALVEFVQRGEKPPAVFPKIAITSLQLMDCGVSATVTRAHIPAPSSVGLLPKTGSAAATPPMSTTAP